ncbi:MAG: hypothetical protein IPP66_02865 [Anaerolineales bacterium]|nr:hypothetical protein [Anaerolineales bacterium]
MKTKSKAKKNFLFHPVLFGLYPVLALYVFNRNEIVVSAIQQAVITSLLVAVVVLSLFLIVFRSWQKVAAPASFSLLLFFSYGHVYDFAQQFSLFGMTVGRDRILLPVWIILFIVGQVYLLRSQNTVLNEMLNSVSLFLAVFLVIQVLTPLVQLGIAKPNPVVEPDLSQSASSPDPIGPDVYYILVDAYSRQDLLQEKLDLDTSGFISELKSLGFYIPDCTQSNYDATASSMIATLNMNYLDAIGLDYYGDKAIYKPFLQKNLITEQFKSMGYATVTFKSLHPLLDFPEATYYFDYFKDKSALTGQAALNFQYLFLKTTLIRPLMEFIERNPDIKLPSYVTTWIPSGDVLNSREYLQYQQNLFALDSLEKTPDLPGRKFVYAHLFTIHQPYVFYPDGRFHPFLRQGSIAYRDQVIYANTRLLEIVKAILEKSNPAPIIVIQGDHSYFSDADRVKILNAYYLPDGGDNMLYPTVTPVNTFRIILNKYFGGQYDLLPDVSRYSNQDRVLQEAPSTCIK